jgi:hypothetical protein
MKFLILFFLLGMHFSHAQENCQTPVEDTVLPFLSSVASNCGLLSGKNYWLCEALHKKNCGLVDGAGYWYCQALVTKNCSLTTGSDFWFCKGVTEGNCGVIKNTAPYWMCKGVTENNCGLVSAKDYWLCYATQRSL